MIGGIEQLCASDICLSRTSGLSREQRGLYRKTKIGTEVAHVTRDSDTTFKVKRSTCRGRGHVVAASRTACYSSDHARADGQVCFLKIRSFLISTFLALKTRGSARVPINVMLQTVLNLQLNLFKRFSCLVLVFIKLLFGSVRCAPPASLVAHAKRYLS